MSIILSPYPKLQFISDNGVPMAGCQLYTYQAGTNTLLATYRDATGTAYNTNPIYLDAGGRANIWIDSNIAYKFVLQNTDNSILWTVDNINSTNNDLLTVVETLSDLMAIDTTTFNGGTVRILGYYIANDGGGGDFTFLPGSTLTPDNGVIVKPTTGAGRWERVCDTEINLLWYGCKGDGYWDNTPYLTAANAYAEAKGWSLYVPQGTFVLNSNPNLTVPVHFGPQALFSWSGFALVLNPIIDDFGQHFDCQTTASVDFGGRIPLIYPEWFGAKGDGSFADNVTTTDDTAAIQYAINSAKCGNWIVFNSAKKYWSGTLTMIAGVSLKGSQSNENDVSAVPTEEYLANLQFNSSGTAFLSLTNSGLGGLRGITVKNLIIDGNSAASVLIDLQTTGSIVMDCTLRNAVIGIQLDGSNDSSKNQFIFNNFRNVTTAISVTGNAPSGNISDNRFDTCTTDYTVFNPSSWIIHDNYQSSGPVIGQLDHAYGAVDYNGNILGAVPASSGGAPSNIILDRVGGWADNSTTYAYDTTSVFNTRYLMRYTTSMASDGARVHDSIGFDSAASVPRIDTRAWYERDVDGSHHWGDKDKEFMTLNNAGVLSFNSGLVSGRVAMASTAGGTDYSYLYYAVFGSQITILPEMYYTTGFNIGNPIVAAMYPCYDVSTPSTQTIQVTATATIPFALGPISFSLFSLGRYFAVGQYVMLLTPDGAGPAPGSWLTYTSTIGKNNEKPFLYGKVTAFDSSVPSITIDVMYYSSHGTANFCTGITPNIYIHSAFPFLTRRTSTWHAIAGESSGYFGTNAVISSTVKGWRVQDIGLILDSYPAIMGISPITCLLSDMIPSTES